jgi:hypothetical protein
VEHTVISGLLQKILLIPMVALWVFHLYQRRFKEAAVRKRIATLSLTVVIIAAWVAAWLFTRYGVGDTYLVLVAAGAVGVVIWQRKRMLPYRVRCARCGKSLALERMLSYDSNLCDACQPSKTEGETHR